MRLLIFGFELLSFTCKLIMYEIARCKKELTLIININANVNNAHISKYTRFSKVRLQFLTLF